MPDDARRRVRDAFLLDPHVTFLNHGSFGACPRAVFNVQRDIRHRIEQQPVRFFLRTLPALLDRARERLAHFVGADREGLVFVPNATAGVNIVLRSIALAPGDELLTTNHAYRACRNALDFVAARRGARVVIAEVPLPIPGPAAIVDAILAQVTDRTRLALIDGVTSSTATIFPIERLVPELHARGVDTLIDGAHTLAMLDVDLESLRPTYFTANCHKWLCSPKGAAILVVDPRMREQVHPLVMSYGGDIPIPGRSVYHREFDWPGTHDPSAFIAAAHAIDELPRLAGLDWPKIRARNRALARFGRDRLLEVVGGVPAVPDELLGSIASVAIPPSVTEPVSRNAGYLPSDPLYEALVERHFEVPVFHWPAPPHRWIRVSAQIYNHPEEYVRLADTVGELLRAERR
ncbi:MAG: aminotransferase class V-fold PLP-dependent enzyme [Planctomycetes bacterium]|nr:aminotransferase class V-fold PLP-dependent enzyme [Planctomycetota bacterium]